MKQAVLVIALIVASSSQSLFANGVDKFVGRWQGTHRGAPIYLEITQKGNCHLLYGSYALSGYCFDIGGLSISSRYIFSFDNSRVRDWQLLSIGKVEDNKFNLDFDYELSGNELGLELKEVNSTVRSRRSIFGSPGNFIAFEKTQTTLKQYCVTHYSGRFFPGYADFMSSPLTKDAISHLTRQDFRVLRYGVDAGMLRLKADGSGWIFNESGGSYERAVRFNWRSHSGVLKLGSTRIYTFDGSGWDRFSSEFPESAHKEIVRLDLVLDKSVDGNLMAPNAIRCFPREIYFADERGSRKPHTVKDGFLKWREIEARDFGCIDTRGMFTLQKMYNLPPAIMKNPPPFFKVDGRPPVSLTSTTPRKITPRTSPAPSRTVSRPPSTAVTQPPQEPVSQSPRPTITKPERKPIPQILGFHYKEKGKNFKTYIRVVGTGSSGPMYLMTISDSDRAGAPEKLSIAYYGKFITYDGNTQFFPTSGYTCKTENGIYKQWLPIYLPEGTITGTMRFDDEDGTVRFLNGRVHGVAGDRSIETYSYLFYPFEYKDLRYSVMQPSVSERPPNWPK